MSARHGFRRRDLLPLALGLCLALAALFVLESARQGVRAVDMTIGTTPVTRYARPGADGPPVVIAHGFAGSRQIMQAFSYTLARAGYVAYAFDFQGHGQNPVPMSGDVSSVNGTTLLLVDQVRQVVAATDSPGQATALLGHSMATDVLVRSAGPQTGPIVLLSAFSREITAETPRDLLLLVGAWEPGLREFARDAVQMIDMGARYGDTVRRNDLRRRALVLPYIDHVSILRSTRAQRQAVDWLDTAYGRRSDISYPPVGWAFVVLLGSIVLLAAPLARLLPQRDDVERQPLRGGQIALLCLLPRSPRR